MGKTRREALRFAAAGVAGLAADVLLLYLALALGLGWYAGRALSFLGAVWVTWRLNRRYTFDVAGAASSWAEWWRYLLAMAGGGLLNYAVYSAAVWLLRDWAPLPALLLPPLAVAAGSLAGMVLNFASAKFFVFQR